MGMIGDFIGVWASELHDYLQDSSLLEARIDATIDAEDPAFFSVDKAWDALSYLINGYKVDEQKKGETPLAWTIYGAASIDKDQDFGYGPAAFLTAAQVKQVNEALSGVSDAVLLKNYDGQRMTALKIYPGGWEDKEQSLDWLNTHLNNLKNFYSNAAANDLAVVMFLS
jgi:Domain of unknown function (DUF1877)